MTDDPLLLIALAACVIVLIILLMGINSFRKGGVEGAKKSNRLMQWRIGAQFVAILLIVAFVYVRGRTGG